MAGERGLLQKGSVSDTWPVILHGGPCELLRASKNALTAVQTGVSQVDFDRQGRSEAF